MRTFALLIAFPRSDDQSLAMIPYIVLISYAVVVQACLWKFFVKAGRKAWEGWVPLYNIYIWNKIIGKPWWWLFLLLVPGVNLLMLIIMNVNLAISFSARDSKHYLLCTFLPWYALPKLAFGEEYKYIGPIPVKERRTTLLAQWGDAILFAVIVATVFRTFTFEAFTIPTGSMEKSLLIGDYLFVSKLSYGPRMPMTPISMPFMHHTIAGTKNTPSFVDWFSQPYYRLPGFGDVERGDAVVFNFPEGDTIVIDMENPSYYQWVRQTPGGVKTIVDKKRVGVGGGRMLPIQGIRTRPLDKRENYIKRCVAVSGETVEVRDGDLFVNNELQPLASTGQMKYVIETKTSLNKTLVKDQYDINPGEVEEGGNRQYRLPIQEGMKDEFGKLPFIAQMIPDLAPKQKTTITAALQIFPNDTAYDWSVDNFGPLWVPKAGEKIDLTLANLPLYRRAIHVYENNSLEVRDGKILINGSEATSYTFKQNYYWMMGDNRHGSQDSRFWGFVPEDHVVGKAVFIWMSADPENGGFPMGIRWKRLFSGVD
ncbi:MAG: S26 family signal peptidase [Flavobacteriales bacterium]|nr:S26 family signal peptidase [Flavobacteriales bacterium]